jgi:predicted transcriptional regulator
MKEIKYMEKQAFGFYLEPESDKRLRAMATTDKRSRSAMLEWLIDQEFKRRIKRNPTLAPAEEVANA